LSNIQKPPPIQPGNQAATITHLSSENNEKIAVFQLSWAGVMQAMSESGLFFSEVEARLDHRRRKMKLFRSNLACSG
jgi:hypothetical protein